MFNSEANQPEFIDDFYLPFGGQMRRDNRWAVLSELIPWDEVDLLYRAKMSGR